MPLKEVGLGSWVVEPASWASTGSQELARRKALPLLQTGNATLDQLLGGGIEPGVVTLLYSASRRLSLCLQQLAVLAQLPQPDGGLNAARVLYVDAENTFDPYGIANFAVAHRRRTAWIPPARSATSSSPGRSSGGRWSRLSTRS